MQLSIQNLKNVFKTVIHHYCSDQVNSNADSKCSEEENSIMYNPSAQNKLMA